MKARAFNNIVVDHDNGILTKSSENIAKIQNEVNYYLNLPQRIAKFFPDLVGYKKDFTAYTIEYIPYKNLSELMLGNYISVEEAKMILITLCKILKEIHCFKSSHHFHRDIQAFYINKTVHRLEQLKINGYFQNLMAYPYIEINHKRYKNFYLLKSNFTHRIQSFIQKNTPVTMIHGDFCFSNILYDLDKKVIKLIDPRGSFGQLGIYGHPYYDYAKLLHCLHGKYDFIINNHFDFQETNPQTFLLDIPYSSLINELHNDYRHRLVELDINLEFLYLIESSLFLSMAVLHYEDIQRQKVFYLIGLMNLNATLEGIYENLY